MLQGKRILLVEDEVVIAMMLEDMITSIGGVAVGPANTLQEGMEIARFENIDAAVLDINLGDATSDAIAEILVSRRIPFILATGYSTEASNVFRVPVLQKPYMLRDLQRALSLLFGPTVAPQ